MVVVQAIGAEDTAVSELNIIIIDASFHHNGISGLGFWAVLFDADHHAGNNEKRRSRMIASLFDEPGVCAVYSISELVNGNIKFACGNSWRGDVYEEELRPMIEKMRETNRFGPFSLLPSS